MQLQGYLSFWQHDSRLFLLAVGIIYCENHEQEVPNAWQEVPRNSFLMMSTLSDYWIAQVTYDRRTIYFCSRGNETRPLAPRKRAPRKLARSRKHYDSSCAIYIIAGNLMCQWKTRQRRMHIHEFSVMAGMPCRSAIQSEHSKTAKKVSIDLAYQIDDSYKNLNGGDFGQMIL